MKYLNSIYKIILTGIFLVASPIASASLIVNGGFEDQPNWGNGVLGDSGFTALTGSQIPGWSIVSGHAVTIHNTSIYPTITGNYSVNMDGEGYNGVNANLFQDFSTVNAIQYELVFDWETWNSNTTPHLEVSIIDTLTSNILYQENMSWASGLHHEMATFYGTGNTFRLQVQENPESGVNDNSYIVDNISITTVSSVPVPPAVWLFGSGLIGLIGIRNKSTKISTLSA